MNDRAPHPDDLAVDVFAAKMKAKLAEARAKGRSGWDDPGACTVEDLSIGLRVHVGKGDPVDVANYAMMLSLRGSVIVRVMPPAGTPAATAEVIERIDQQMAEARHEARQKKDRRELRSRRRSDTAK